MCHRIPQKYPLNCSPPDFTLRQGGKCGRGGSIHRYVTELTACSQRGISVKDKGLSAEGSVGSPMREKGTARHQISKNPSRKTGVFCVMRHKISEKCPLNCSPPDFTLRQGGKCGRGGSIHRYVTELTGCSQRGISVKDTGLVWGLPMREKGTARH